MRGGALSTATGSGRRRRRSRDASRSPSAGPAGADASEAIGGLRVASYNVQSCVGSDMRCDIPRVARALRRMGPLDLVALQEIDITAEEDQVAELARLAGFPHHAFVATRRSERGAGEYGDAVLSMLPIQEEVVHRFRRWRWRMGRACLFVRVEGPPDLGGPVWFGSAHLQHDITALENGEQLAELRQAASELSGGSRTCAAQSPDQCTPSLSSGMTDADCRAVGAAGCLG